SGTQTVSVRGCRRALISSQVGESDTNRLVICGLPGHGVGAPSGLTREGPGDAPTISTGSGVAEPVPVEPGDVVGGERGVGRLFVADVPDRDGTAADRRGEPCLGLGRDERVVAGVVEPDLVLVALEVAEVQGGVTFGGDLRPVATVGL